MTLSPASHEASEGGAAVAQPARVAAWAFAASLTAFGLGTLGLMIWAGTSVWHAGGGRLGAPLDDSYIHFQFAESFARFAPFEYAPGQGRVPGATSLLWPALLVPAIWLGASAQGLIAVTWLLGFGALFGQACEVYLAGRRFMHEAFAFSAGCLVLCLSANTWFAGSAMEVVPLGFLLLRCARRAAEYLEGARSPGRQRELLALAFAAALLRPEGALGALLVGVAFLGSGKSNRWRGALALAAPLSAPLINLLFTGSAQQTTAAAKWLPMNPYFHDRLWPAVLGNLELLYGTLLDGREWSWTFVPEGFRFVAIATLPALWLAGELKGARAHVAFLCVVGLGMLAPTTYETFLVNRLRYLWPFSAPWLLGLAALGHLLGAALSRVQPRLILVGLVIPALSAYGFAKLAPISVADLAQSAAAISAQQVELGKWAAASLPARATIGVNDAGAIAFFSGKPTFDVVGLTTRGEARYWVAGAGSRFEHYERLPRSALPSHFIVYPGWFALPSLLGPCLSERRVEGATILGGTVMVACVADYTSLGSGKLPILASTTGALLDELDVADLESEAAHGYVLGWTNAQDNVVVQDVDVVDGGRARRLGDSFWLGVEGGGALVLRLGAEQPSELTIRVDGVALESLSVMRGPFQELRVAIPASLGRRSRAAVLVRSSAPLTLLHYWSFGPG
jgi:hypothetical protein